GPCGGRRKRLRRPAARDYPAHRSSKANTAKRRQRLPGLKGDPAELRDLCPLSRFDRDRAAETATGVSFGLTDMARPRRYLSIEWLPLPGLGSSKISKTASVCWMQEKG